MHLVVIGVQSSIGIDGRTAVVAIGAGSTAIATIAIAIATIAIGSIVVAKGIVASWLICAPSSITLAPLFNLLFALVLQD
jgi:hypothetical protein